MNKEQLLEFLSRMDTMKTLIKLNNPEKYEQLVKKERYWIPNIRPLMYYEWVRENYIFDPNDALTLCIYSLLMNMPIRELQIQKVRKLIFEVKKI